MKNAKYKKILIAIVITISIVICTAISYIGISHLAVYVILPHIFGPVDVEPEERYVYFDDGSVLERKGGPTYEHTLFDNYALYRGDNSFEYRFINSTSEIAVEKQFGMVFKYAFDPSGYIAYRYLEQDWNSGKPVLYQYNGDDIILDTNILYECKTDTIYEFESMNELYNYCKENSINLGVWYYPDGRHVYQQKTLFDVNGWQLSLNYANVYETVSDNGIQLFAGTIDRYFYTDRYIAFHFRLIDHYNYEIEENPVIKYSEDTVVGKLLFSDVYADSYVFVDTETGKYTLFDSKKEIEEYAGSLGISHNWEKVKYES